MLITQKKVIMGWNYLDDYLNVPPSLLLEEGRGMVQKLSVH